MWKASSRGSFGCARIDVPDQPMRIAQAVGPDLLARAGECREGIVVGDPVAAVLADRAGRRMLAQVGHDAQDLADERVEPLRIDPAAVALIARARVPRAQVHHPPVGIAVPSDRIEGHLAQRMLRQRLLQPHQLTRRALEGRVGRIAIPPLDQHDLSIDPARPPSAWESPASSCSRPDRGLATTPASAPASRHQPGLPCAWCRRRRCARSRDRTGS